MCPVMNAWVITEAFQEKKGILSVSVFVCVYVHAHQTPVMSAPLGASKALQ